VVSKGVVMSDGSGVAVGWATAPPTIIWFQAMLDEAGTKQLSVMYRFAYGFGERFNRESPSAPSTPASKNASQIR
jgi:hypothetical protein